jgi:hypothetical protein
MQHGDKIILDLCGGTGSWSEPWCEAGYDVRLITLPTRDVRTWHIIGYLDRKTLGFNPSMENRAVLVEEIPLERVGGILAAPPCTMFSRARTTAKTPRDFDGAIDVVRACLEVVWYCRAHGNLQWWALENPMGLLRQFLGAPAFSFRGREFGDSHTKFTDLRGYFEPPKKKARGEEARIVELLEVGQSEEASKICRSAVVPRRCSSDQPGQVRQGVLSGKPITPI